MLRIVCWRSSLDAMPKPLKTYRVQPFTEDGKAVLNPRTIQTRTEDGAVKKLVRWMQYEGYEVEGLCVHLEEICESD